SGSQSRKSLSHAVQEGKSSARHPVGGSESDRAARVPRAGKRATTHSINAGVARAGKRGGHGAAPRLALELRMVLAPTTRDARGPPRFHRKHLQATTRKPGTLVSASNCSSNALSALTTSLVRYRMPKWSAIPLRRASGLKIAECSTSQKRPVSNETT